MENAPVEVMAGGPSTSQAAIANTSSSAPVGEELDTPKKDKSFFDRYPLMSGFSKLDIVRQLGLVIGVATAVTVGFLLIMLAQKENFKPLMSTQDNYQSRDVIEILQLEQIEFDIDPGTSLILVRANDLHKARLAIAKAGLADEKTVGLEILDKDSGLGTSQFIENARYKRGLEGELARTITSMNSVKNSRVHLAIPKRSVFVRDHRKPTASVFLEIYAGRAISVDQVKAIINLVSSSISEMSAEDVSVVDQKGNLLSDIDENSSEELTKKQFEYTKKIEQSLAENIINILAPVLGDENFKAEVSANVDFSVVEQTDEQFNPDLPAIRSEQTIDERRIGDENGGIPGALTNQPPGMAIAPEQIDPATGQPMGKNQKSRSEATRNFELDRTLSYTKYQQGRVQRISVAVAVNDKPIVAEDGTVTHEPWTPEELQRLTILVRDAVGYDALRGDSVNVVNSFFRGDKGVAFEKLPLWEQPWFWEVVLKYGSILLGLVFVFLFAKTLIKHILARRKELDSFDLDDNLDDVAEDEDMGENFALANTANILLPNASEGYARQMDALKGLIAQDPQRVAQQVIKWVNQDG